MPNARNIIFICCLLKLMVFFGAVLGCRTTSEPITDNAIVEHSQQLAALERGIIEYGESVATVRDRLAAVSDGIRAVGDRASDIDYTVSETIVLFSEYQRAVEQLLQDYDHLRTKIDTAYAGNSSTIDDTGD